MTPETHPFLRGRGDRGSSQLPVYLLSLYFKKHTVSSRDDETTAYLRIHRDVEFEIAQD